MDDAKHIPEFRSYDEMAEFWETHDVGEYWEQTDPVEFEISHKARDHHRKSGECVVRAALTRTERRVNNDKESVEEGSRPEKPGRQ